jgi:hypothetical protein
MNQTLKSTLDIIRSISKNADIKIHRSFTDFLSDRIVQAVTQPTLLATIERLATLLNSEIGSINDSVVVAFMKQSNSKDSQSVLEWLRDYPRVAAMIVMQKTEESYNECLNDIEIVVSENNKGTALPSASYDINMKITCLSPLSHGADTKAGNATIFRRMQVLSTTEQVLSLPFYAGNALRGQLRDLLADHFLISLGLVPRKDNPPCKLWFFHALYAGGALEENSEQAKTIGKKMGNNGSVKAEGVYEFRDMIPFLSLLGTALGNRIISGRINVCDLKPQCKEWGSGKISVGNLFEWLYLTRREDHENHVAGDNSSMIVNTECLKSGTILVGGIDISDHISELELSCLAMGLKLLQQSGYLGAENRRGLGNVSIEIEKIQNEKIYQSFLNENKKTILEYLTNIGALN